MNAPQFQLTNVVFYVTVNWTDKDVPCPDCLGKRTWFTRLPTGEEFNTPCPTCKCGYEGSRGTILDHDFHGHVICCEVAGLTRKGEGFEYVLSNLRCNAVYHVDETEIYFDESEAKAVAAAEVDRVSHEKRAHDARMYASKRKDRVGGMLSYYRKEIRDAKKKIANAEKGLAEMQVPETASP